MNQSHGTGPEALLETIQQELEALRHIVTGFGEAQTIVRRLDGEISFWSRGAERLYGWQTCEAVGQTCHALLRTVFPVPLPQINQQLREVGVWQGELRHTHRNGAHVHVASHWVLRTDGPVPLVIEVNADISERVRGDEARLYHAAIVSDSDDAIVSKTLDGVVTSWNRAAEAMFGWDAASIIGRPIATIIPPDLMDEEAEIIARLRIGLRVDHFDTTRLRRDGTRVLVSLTVSPIRGPSGLIIGASKILRDIGRQRQVESALAHAKRAEAIGKLAAGVAHDFNNILSVVAGNIEVLKTLTEAGSEARAIVEEVLQAVASGGELTRRLLTFEQPRPLDLRAVDLTPYLAGCVALLRRMLGAGIEIETGFDPAPWQVRADASQIGDVLINLALNARDAMPDGGRLVVETANVRVDEDVGALAAGEYMLLSVADTGTGMAPEVLERAVEPLFTTKTAGIGSGLGLSMVQGVVGAHGGQLGIESVPGHGTVVNIWLKRAATTDRSEPSPDDMFVAGGAESIVVVEDNPMLRAMVVRNLEALGYRVVAAASGAEAMRLLEAGTVCDLLFTDIVLPGGMTGWQLADAVLAQAPGCRVLFTSGFAAHEPDWPADSAVLRKPYRRDTLARAVRAALDPRVS